MKKVIVLFEVTIKEGKQEAYLVQAASLKESLSQAEGFLGSERFSSLAVPGKILSKSEWRDEECVTKWRNQANVHWATLLLLPMGVAIQMVYSPLVVLGQQYLPNHVGLRSCEEPACGAWCVRERTNFGRGCSFSFFIVAK